MPFPVAEKAKEQVCQRLTELKGDYIASSLAVGQVPLLSCINYQEAEAIWLKVYSSWNDIYCGNSHRPGMICGKDRR